MKTKSVLFTRVYISESSHLLQTLVSYLKHNANIRGMSVFKAATGFGETGEHVASLMDLSLDLPLVIEFFDEKNKVMSAIEYITTLVKPEHVVFWEVKTSSP